jgi:hypothetical protein
MTKFKVKEVNCETGEEIVRDANAEELAQIEARKISTAEAEAEAQAKATVKAAILDRLGLTADELKTILG